MITQIADSRAVTFSAYSLLWAPVPASLTGLRASCGGVSSSGQYKSFKLSQIRSGSTDAKLLKVVIAICNKNTRNKTLNTKDYYLWKGVNSLFRNPKENGYKLSSLLEFLVPKQSPKSLRQKTSPIVFGVDSMFGLSSPPPTVIAVAFCRCTSLAPYWAGHCCHRTSRVTGFINFVTIIWLLLFAMGGDILRNVLNNFLPHKNLHFIKS